MLFSPEHGESLATLGVAQVRRVVDLWAERTTALLERPEIEYVLVFENRGREVGATIDHPHGQIYGYPFVPPAPAREIRPGEQCAVCRDLAAELDAGTRIVARHGDWVAWVPFASGYAYGLRIAPRSHVASLPALDDQQRDDLARMLVDVLARYDRLWPEMTTTVPLPVVVPPGARAAAATPGTFTRTSPRRCARPASRASSRRASSAAGHCRIPSFPKTPARALRDA